MDEVNLKTHEIATKVSEVLADELNVYIVPALVLLVAISLCELCDTDEELEKGMKSINEMLRTSVELTKCINLEIMQ